VGSLVSDLSVIPIGDAGARQIPLSDTVGPAPLSPKWPSPYATRHQETANAMPQVIVSNWSRLSRANLSGNIYGRILQIARRQDGWRGQGSKRLTEEALKAWLDFWTAVSGNALEPALALTARGTLQAEWFRNSRRHLDLEFVSSERIFFGLFDGPAAYEGVDTIEALVPWLADHRAHPLQWRS
jgi:hypothetical protein